MSLWTRLGLVVLLQSTALIVMIGMKQYTLATGTPIVLKTAPIDPRSLFSGDYVRLNYDISRLQPAQLGGDRDFARGDSVYVALTRQGDYWVPVALHRNPPEAAAGRVVIKGKVEYVEHGGPQGADQSRTALNIRYGIESYFVPEGEGRALERPHPDEVISIRVVVDRYGNAGIKAVLVNGKERYVEKLL